jgi:predicted LPLAT superfamily acyltransferase
MKEEDVQHWSQQKEKTAGYWNVKLLLVLFKIFPVIVMRILAFPVGFFYFVFSKKTRNASKHFLLKISPFIDDPKTKKRALSFFGPLRHIVSFSLSLIEKIQSWGGNYQFKNIHFQDDDIEELINELDNGKGVFLIVSHLGNIELLRGLASFSRTGVSREVPVTAIVNMKVTKHFIRMLKELNPRSSLDVIGADEIGPETAITMEEKLAAGEIVTVAGDRTSLNTAEKDIRVSFFGEEAPFSIGAFYLAALLKAPVYFVFGLRRGDLSIKPEYDMHVVKYPLPFDITRKERLAQSAKMASSYASLLETHCKKHPFQWYNFFNFWSKGI